MWNLLFPCIHRSWIVLPMPTKDEMVLLWYVRNIPQVLSTRDQRHGMMVLRGEQTCFLTLSHNECSLFKIERDNPVHELKNGLVEREINIFWLRLVGSGAAFWLRISAHIRSWPTRLGMMLVHYLYLRSSLGHQIFIGTGQHRHVHVICTGQTISFMKWMHNGETALAKRESVIFSRRHLPYYLMQ